MKHRILLFASEIFETVFVLFLVAISASISQAQIDSAKLIPLDEIRHAMDRRWEVLSNIEFSATVLRVFDEHFEHSANDRPVDLDVFKNSKFPRYSVRRVEQKRVDGSYLSSIYQGSADKPTVPSVLYCKNFYNAKDGVNKGMAGFEGLRENDGRISNSEDKAEHQNMINCVFGRRSTDYFTSLYVCVEDVLQSNDLTSIVDGGRLELKSVKKKVGSTGRIATWTNSVVFDTNAGYTPISMVSVHEMNWVNSVTTDAIFMAEMTPLKDIKVPRQVKFLREVRQEGKAKPIPVYEFKIDYLDAGHLSISDLSYEYPARTAVVDELAQNAYFVDLDGSKTSLDTPIGFASSDESKADIGFVFTFFFVNAVTILMIGLVVMLYRLLRHKAS